jgi:hypothetical protein
MSLVAQQTGQVPAYSRRKVPSYECTLSIVRELSENATLRPSPFLLPPWEPELPPDVVEDGNESQ